MARRAVNHVLVAGGGIAGLTAAIAFARRGSTVDIFERADALEEIGAGLQLSPNATRILADLGVLDWLGNAAVEPDAVVLRRGADLREIGRVQLGDAASRRWGAPYLVCHRADLQDALLRAVRSAPGITLNMGASVEDFDLEPTWLKLPGGEVSNGDLLVAADGVWSAIRSQGGDKGRSRFIGQLAWRTTISADDPEWQAVGGMDRMVCAFLSPGFHMVAYPISGGAAVNLVAFMAYRKELPAGWSRQLDPAILRQAIRAAAPALVRLADKLAWTAYPIHVADLDGSWSDGRGLALIGDAAHAMTPFAAQGAAMAIEDAETLARAVCGGDNLATALQAWTIARRRRVLRVARRGAFNAFAWHARGPVAVARDMILRWRGPERLAADLDWLYGWRPD